MDKRGTKGALRRPKEAIEGLRGTKGGARWKGVHEKSLGVLRVTKGG